jgi:phospholipid transport system substrate-binding protein
VQVPFATLAAAAILAGGLPEGRAQRARPMDELAASERALAAAVQRRVPDWSPEAEAIRMQVQRLLGAILDYEAMARRALGPNWAALNDGQRRQFVEVFAELTRQRFVQAMARPGVRVKFDSETVAGPDASVLARVTVPRDPQPLEQDVEYRLSRRSDRWVVQDVLVDQVSLIATYQADFGRLLRRGGFDELLTRMRRKAAGDQPR